MLFGIELMRIILSKKLTYLLARRHHIVFITGCQVARCLGLVPTGSIRYLKDNVLVRSMEERCCNRNERMDYIYSYRTTLRSEMSSKLRKIVLIIHKLSTKLSVDASHTSKVLSAEMWDLQIRIPYSKTLEVILSYNTPNESSVHHC